MENHTDILSKLRKELPCDLVISLVSLRPSKVKSVEKYLSTYVASVLFAVARNEINLMSINGWMDKESVIKHKQRNFIQP